MHLLLCIRPKFNLIRNKPKNVVFKIEVDAKNDVFLPTVHSNRQTVWTLSVSVTRVFICLLISLLFLAIVFVLDPYLTVHCAAL